VAVPGRVELAQVATGRAKSWDRLEGEVTFWSFVVNTGGRIEVVVDGEFDDQELEFGRDVEDMVRHDCRRSAKTGRQSDERDNNGFADRRVITVGGWPRKVTRPVM